MSRIDRSESVRQGRIPVASNRAPLVTRGLDTENFVYRWVINLEERIEKFLQGGYELVKKNTNISAGEPTVEESKSLDNCITKPAGRGFKLYLMRIPKEFYEEDQKVKEAEINETEEAIRRHGTGKADYGKVDIQQKGPSQ